MKRKIFIILILSFTLLTLTSCRKKLTVVFDYIYKTEEVTVKKGKKVEKPTDPIREGYTFLEWQLDGKSYDFSKKVKSNLTLVAIYSDNESPIITLNTPQNVKYENNLITWDKVDNAKSYNVNIDGSIYNTTSNSYSYSVDLKEKGFVTITIVACSNNGVSKTSKAIFVEQSYSISEMNQILDTKLSETNNKDDLAYYNSICAALTKYQFTIKEMNKIRDIKEMIDNNRLADYIGMYSFLINLDQKITYDQLTSLEKPEINDELQALFEDMKNNNVYSSNNTVATEDEKFTNLVVGGLGYFAYLVPMKPSNYPSVYDYLNKFFTFVKYSSYKSLSYDIRKNEETVTFISQIDSKEYKLSEDEIMKIMRYYYDTKEKEYENLYIHTDDARKRIYNTEFLYGTYLYDLKEYNNNALTYETICEDEVKLYNEIEQNKDKINKIIKDIYTFYENITNGTYSEYGKTLDKIINGDTSVETLTLLKNQVIELLSSIQNIIKSKDDIALIFNIIENAKFLTTNTNASTIKLLEIELKIMIDVIKQFEKTINELNISDLQIALKLLNEPNNQEAINKIEELFETFNNNLKNIDVSNINTKLILDSLDTFFIEKFGKNYKSLFSIEYGLQFNDKEITLLENEIKELVEYIVKYPNFDEIKNALLYHQTTEDNLQNSQLNLENLYQVENIDEFIKYMIDYITTEKFDKYSFYIKSYIESKYKDYNVEEDKYYQIVYKNLDILKKFYFTEIKINIETKEYENEEKLRKSLEIVKQEFTNDEMKNYLFAKKQIDNLLNNKNETITTNPYYSDFTTSIDKLINLIGKYDLQLTSEESKLIVEFRKIFNKIKWSYPSWVEVVIDQENKQVNIKFKDDFLKICPNIKMTDYGAFSIMIYEPNNESFRIYFEERLSAKLHDTMISISFYEIAKTLKEHKYLDSVEEFTNTYGDAYISVEFVGSLESIQYVLDGKYGYYTNLESLRRCNYLNDYLEEIFATLK